MEPSDSELMKLVCAGDGDAFAVIVARYKDPLVNYLTHLVRSRERAEDVAQEAFVRLFRNADRYREHEKVAPYLYKIATNHTISEMRREKRWRLLLPRFDAGISRHTPSPDADLMTDEVQRKVSAAMEQVPLKFRAPLTLYEIEEWSYDDIARSLGCRVGTVKSRIHRARELMRRQLQGWWTGEPHERHRNLSRDEAPTAHERVATLRL
jgi:RNA polymerase sigma-70 factor (ECF subfamily)